MPRHSPDRMKAPPALLALIDAQVIGRKRMPHSTVARDSIEPNLAQTALGKGTTWVLLMANHATNTNKINNLQAKIAAEVRLDLEHGALGSCRG
jgi:hypothetical protein